MPAAGVLLPPLPAGSVDGPAVPPVGPGRGGEAGHQAAVAGGGRTGQPAALLPPVLPGPGGGGRPPGRQRGEGVTACFHIIFRKKISRLLHNPFYCVLFRVAGPRTGPS